MGFQYGSTVYPLVAGEATSLLPVCDPALAKILDYLKFAILKYANAAIIATVAIPETDDSATTIQSAIRQVAPIDPDTIARAEQWQFPLWCGWSKSVKYNHKTLNWVCDVRRVGLAYILPPLTASQSIRWLPILNSISEICNAALAAGHDVDYNDNERILVDNQITAARLISADFGAYDFAGSGKPPYFPAWVADLELEKKQSSYTTGLVDFDGADIVATHQSDDDLSTTIAANASIGATSILVASSAGFHELDVVVIGKDTVREEEVVVTAIPDATHLTIGAPGLAIAHTLAQADAVARKPVQIINAKSDVG